MRPDRTWRSSVTLIAAGLLVASLLASVSAAAENCPPQSSAPACTGEEPGGDPQPPADPKPDEPADNAPPHEEPTREPDPGGGTSPGPSDGGGAPQVPAVLEDEEAEEEATPPPPPDLGPRRTISSRLRPVGGAMDVSVVVDERDARGVDGGWSITVSLEGFPGGFDVTRVRPSPSAQAVTRAPEAVFQHGVPHRLFAVFGQSSAERYAGRYTAQGTVELPTAAGSEGDGPPLVVITLYQ